MKLVSHQEVTGFADRNAYRAYLQGKNLSVQQADIAISSDELLALEGNPDWDRFKSVVSELDLWLVVTTDFEGDSVMLLGGEEIVSTGEDRKPYWKICIEQIPTLEAYRAGRRYEQLQSMLSEKDDPDSGKTKI